MMFHSLSLRAYRMAESSFSELESRNHANHQLETRTSGIAPKRTSPWAEGTISFSQRREPFRGCDESGIACLQGFFFGGIEGNILTARSARLSALLLHSLRSSGGAASF